LLTSVTSRSASKNKQPDPLRTWLVSELQSHTTHCIHQEILIENGANTLVKLAVLIRDHCDLVVHIVGNNPGSIPDVRFAPELFRFCDESLLRNRLPVLFETIAGKRRWQQLSYTQWEGWLTCFFNKAIAVCRFVDDSTVSTSAMTMEEHLHLGNPFFGRPTECHSKERILIHVLKRQGNLLQEPMQPPSKIDWRTHRGVGRSLIADREVETQQFRNVISNEVPERVLLLFGPSNRGKSTLLKEFRVILSATPGIASAVGNLKDGASLRSLILKLAEDLAPISYNFQKLCSSKTETGSRELSALFETALSNIPKPTVLLVDTFEDATVECKEWFEESLLPFIRRSDSVRLVVAGHAVPNPIEPWNDICQRVDVGPINKAKYWCQYRDALGLHSPNNDEIEKFVAITKGDPSILSALITSSKPEGAK
jgi:hypothetical protein